MRRALLLPLSTSESPKMKKQGTCGVDHALVTLTRDITKNIINLACLCMTIIFFFFFFEVLCVVDLKIGKWRTFYSGIVSWLRDWKWSVTVWQCSRERCCRTFPLGLIWGGNSCASHEASINGINPSTSVHGFHSMHSKLKDITIYMYIYITR